MTLRDYAQALLDAGGGTYQSCAQAPEAWVAVSIDGNAGWLIRNTCKAPWAQTVVQAGDRFDTFLIEDRIDYPDGPPYRAIRSTVDLRPKDAVVPPGPTGAPASTP